MSIDLHWKYDRILLWIHLALNFFLVSNPFIIVSVSSLVFCLLRLLIYSWFNFGSLNGSKQSSISFRISHLMKQRFLKYLFKIFRISFSQCFPLQFSFVPFPLFAQISCTRRKWAHWNQPLICWYYPVFHFSSKVFYDIRCTKIDCICIYDCNIFLISVSHAYLDLNKVFFISSYWL